MLCFDYVTRDFYDFLFTFEVTRFKKLPQFLELVYLDTYFYYVKFSNGFMYNLKTLKFNYDIFL